MVSLQEGIAALVPMKGHSERVPGKNLRPLGDRPLYHWIITSLLAVPRINSIHIDTDSEEIAGDVRVNFPNVHIIYRPANLCGDFVEMNSILLHDVQHAREDVILQTHATNPFLQKGTINFAIDAFLANRGLYDSLFTVTEWRTRLYWRDGRPLNHDPEKLLRTQDLEPVCEENSCLYIFERKSLVDTGRRIGRHPLLLPISRLDSVDIDEEFDFIIAQCLTHLLDGTIPA